MTTVSDETIAEIKALQARREAGEFDWEETNYADKISETLLVEGIKQRLYSQCELRPSEVLVLKYYITQLEHRFDTANEYIESRKENMLSEHYDDLKYILNECDLESSW